MSTGRKALIGGVVVVGLALVVALAAWGPMKRSGAYKTMVAASSPATATDAAKRWYLLVADRPDDITALLDQKAGRPEARILVATNAKRFAALLTIAEQQDQPAVRAAALAAASDCYDLVRHEAVALPAALPAWAGSPDSPDEVAAAAFALLTKTNRSANAAIALQVLAQPNVATARETQALDTAAALLSTDSVGAALTLLAGPVGPTAAAHEKFADAVEKCVGTRDLDAVITLLANSDAGVKVLALRCLGQGVSVGNGPQAEARRADLAKQLLPRLGKDVPLPELAATMRAVRNLQLGEAAEPFLALIPLADELTPYRVDGVWMAEALGRTFVTMRIEKDRAGADATLGKIVAALADEKLRTVAAKALRQVEDTSLDNYYGAVEALASYIATSQASLESLNAMVGHYAGGGEAKRSCGESAAKWKTLLDTDKKRVVRLAEIKTWLSTHTDKDINRSLGVAKLKTAATFIDAAKKELMDWQVAKSFPLSSGSAEVNERVEKLKIFSKLVHEQLVAAGNAGSK